MLTIIIVLSKVMNLTTATLSTQITNTQATLAIMI